MGNKSPQCPEYDNGCECKQCEIDDKTTFRYRPDWMNNVDDKKELRDLNIPGSHNSMALYEWGRFEWLVNGYGKCQNLTLKQQLNLGIRFIDIRLRREVDDSGKSIFSIYHGIIHQNATFADVINDCYEWLKKHPSELIMMSYRANEQRAKGEGVKSHEEIWNSYIAEDDKRWLYVQNCYDDVGQMKIEELRGKIIVINRGWDTHKFLWQDLWGEGANQKKKDEVDKYIQLSNQDKNNINRQLCVNHLTGMVEPSKDNKNITEWVFPSTVAKEMYRFAMDRKIWKYRVGVIVMDFVERSELIEQIIKSNME